MFVDVLSLCSLMLCAGSPVCSRDNHERRDGCYHVHVTLDGGIRFEINMQQTPYNIVVWCYTVLHDVTSSRLAMEQTARQYQVAPSAGEGPLMPC
jgi:hypothetical protein